MTASPHEHSSANESSKPSTLTTLTRFLGALDEPPQPGAQFAGVANIEIVGPRRVFVVQFSERSDAKGKRLAMFPDVEDVLAANAGDGTEIDSVDMMMISPDPIARPTLQRVSTILAHRQRHNARPRFLIVTDSGEVVPVPSDKDVVPCENYELVFLSGRWMSEHSTRRFCSRQQIEQTTLG